MVDKKSIKKKSVLQKQKQKPKLQPRPRKRKPVEKDNEITLEKQQQQQSVVVNINTHKPKLQPIPRKPVEKDNETLLEKQQKQLIYPSVIHTQPENIFDKVMSIQRQAQIDNALEQLTKTERNNLLENAKKDKIKPKIVEISSRKFPEPSILGSSSFTSSFSSYPFHTSSHSSPISVSGSFTNVPLTAPAPVAPATTTLLTPINTTQSPITTTPQPTPINTTVQRDITVLETPAVPESAIVAYVGNKTPSQNTAQQAPAAESRPYLTAINIPSSYSDPFSGLGQKLDTTLTDLSTKYISRQLLAEITQKSVDDAQRNAEKNQLNEPNESAIILSSQKKLKQKSPPPKEKKYLSREQIADLGQEKINIPLLRSKKKKEEEEIKNKKELMAKSPPPTMV